MLLAACGIGPAAAQPGCADAAVSMPVERFEDQGDGTVTDRRSGLTWLRCSLGQQWDGGRCRGEAQQLDWAGALEAARALNADGRLFFSDWRLPQLHELAQVTERRCTSPRTNPAVFPDTPPAAYWSATPRAGDPSRERSYALDFGSAGVRLEDRRERLHVRLVRSGR